MAYTLFDLAYRTMRELGTVKEGSATGGSNATLVDTNDRTEADDYWNGGTLFMVATTDGLAPLGEYSVISDFVAGTDTLSLRTNLTATSGAGDRYALGKRRYPLETVLQKINAALQELGQIPVTDKTTIVTADNQTEHSLPAACLFGRLRQVWVQQEDSDPNDNRWTELRNWRVEKSVTGTADLLILPEQYASGYDLKLVYIANHPEMRIYNDKLSEAVPLERVIPTAVLKCLEWYRDKTRLRDFDRAIDEWRARADDARKMYPIPIPRRLSKLMIVRGEGLNYESKPDKVYLL